MIKQFRMMDMEYNIMAAPAFSPDHKFVIASAGSSLQLLDTSTGDVLATYIGFKDGEWLVTTPNGYYNASEKGDQYLKVTVGGRPYTVAQLRESFFRPDLVKVALSGGSLKSFRRMADVKPPPTVSIVDTPSSINTNETVITVKISDSGGGIGDVRLYLNGSAVLLDNARGIALAPTQNAASVYKKYTIKLTSGVNSIRAIAFNGDNSMQSTDALHVITASYKSITKPNLHALVVGINDYKNPKLQLKYAISPIPSKGAQRSSSIRWL